jgi:hypothetical protein
MHPEKDVVKKLEGLLKRAQAGSGQGHIYIAVCCREAITEIKRLREYEWMYEALSESLKSRVR